MYKGFYSQIHLLACYFIRTDSKRKNVGLSATWASPSLIIRGLLAIIGKWMVLSHLFPQTTTLVWKTRALARFVFILFTSSLSFSLCSSPPSFFLLLFYPLPLTHTHMFSPLLSRFPTLWTWDHFFPSGFSLYQSKYVITCSNVSLLYMHHYRKWGHNFLFHSFEQSLDTLFLPPAFDQRDIVNVKATPIDRAPDTGELLCRG